VADERDRIQYTRVPAFQRKSFEMKECGKKDTGKDGESFPQAKFGHSTLTEKIHSYRIAASEGPIRSMVKGHDESTR
jgi:hypothetical protein